MDPETIRQWQRILKDTIAVFVGVFLLVYGAVAVHDPTALGIILGAGITCLSAPPFVRLRLERATQEEDDDRKDR